MQRLKNKTAIVTGAAHGIGRAIAQAFAKEGASVFVLDFSTKRPAPPTAKEIGATFVPGATSPPPPRLTRAVKKAGNRIDILCNNAAYIGQWHNAGESTDEEWDKCYRVSLLGTEYCTRAVLPMMTAQRSGSIINISSIQGLVGGRNSAAYTTVKHALIGFTRSVAYDFGPHNIRCNALCPGAIRTRISPPDGSELHQRQISQNFPGPHRRTARSRLRRRIPGV